MRASLFFARVFPKRRLQSERKARAAFVKRLSRGLRQESLEPRRMLTQADVIGDAFPDRHDSDGFFSDLLVAADVSGGDSSDGHDGTGGGGCPVCGGAYCVMHLDAQGNEYAELSAVPDDAVLPLDAFASILPSAPLADTFFLHSRPSAEKVIYLDFDGESVSGTPWNSSLGVETIVKPAYDTDGDPGSFSDGELAAIQNIWARVVEDFAPFDVNVTTELPDIEDLKNTGGGDTRWGIRVIIGGDSSVVAPGAGGVAYLNSFDDPIDNPTWVFPDNLFTVKNIAEATSHEVGHTLGLRHDGGGGDGNYYRGHGSGPTSWAPIMGVGYGKQVVQWSKGEYAGANNPEDDLAKIVSQNGFGYRPDDYGSTIATAYEPNFPEGTVSTADVSGVI
jgi:hypothetical protein